MLSEFWWVLVLIVLGAGGFWLWRRSRRKQTEKWEHILEGNAEKEAPPPRKPSGPAKVPANFTTAAKKAEAQEDPAALLERTMRRHALSIQQTELAKLKDWKWGIDPPAMISFVWRQTVSKDRRPVRMPYIGNIGSAEAWLEAITLHSRYVVKVEPFDPLDTDGTVNDYLAFLKLLQEGGERAKPWIHGGANYNIYSMAYMLATGQEAAQLSDGTIGEMERDTRMGIPSFDDIVGEQQVSTDQFEEPTAASDAPTHVMASTPSGSVIVDMFDVDPHALTAAPEESAPVPALSPPEAPPVSPREMRTFHGAPSPLAQQKLPINGGKPGND